MTETKNTKNNEAVASQVDFLDDENPGDFKDDVKLVYSTGRGLTEQKVREISAEKGEPQWMLDYRLAAYKTYQKLPFPNYGPDLSDLELDKMLYFQKATDKTYRDWADVPDDIKRTFDRLGVPQAERKYLAGASAQYESEVVYHNIKKEFDKLGIIFMDMDSALKQYPDLVHQYFGTLVHPSDNKFAALNGAVWSGGSFIYVPRAFKLMCRSRRTSGSTRRIPGSSSGH